MSGYHKGISRKREARLVEVTKLYCEQRPYREIGDMLGVTHVQIVHDVKVILDRWRERSVDKVDKLIAESLIRYNNVISKLWECYYRTFENVKTTRTKGEVRSEKQEKNKKADKKMVPVEQTITNEEYSEAARVQILAEIRKTEDKIVDLLSLSTRKIEVVGKSLDTIKQWIQNDE